MNPPYDDRRAKRVLAVTCMATFMAFVDVTIVNTAFPDMVRSFGGTSLGDLSWIINSYTVLFAALLLPAGRIADLIGRRRVFLAGIVLFTAASAACAAAPTLGFLIGARAVQGVAAAAMIPTGLALMLPEFPPARWPIAIGVWGASNSVAAALGPALGGSLVELYDWRLVFLINVPIGIGGVIAGARVLRESRDANVRRLPDLLGTAQLAIGVSLVFLAIVKGNDWGWTAASTLGTLAAGLVVFGEALRRSSSHPVPAIETSLWSIPGMKAVNLASLLAGAAMLSFILGGSLFLTSIWNYSVLDAGLAMTTGAVASAIASPIAGRLIARYGERPVVMIGATVFAANGFAMSLLAPLEPHFFEFWVPTGIAVGWGFGFVFPGLASAASSVVPPDRFGAGIALNMTTRQIGAGLGIAGFIAILETGSSPLIDRFSSAWMLCGAASAAVAIAAVGLAPRRASAPAGVLGEEPSPPSPAPAVAGAPAEAAT